MGRTDQRALILLNSSLTEEAATKILVLSIAHGIWLSLEKAYSNAYVECIHSLRDSLRTITKGTFSVSDYSRKFKHSCGKISAIGCPVDDMDKLHWFLCGLGASFETFSNDIRTSKPAPSFHDLVLKPKGMSYFFKLLMQPPHHRLLLSLNRPDSLVIVVLANLKGLLVENKEKEGTTHLISNSVETMGIMPLHAPTCTLMFPMSLQMTLT